MMFFENIIKQLNRLISGDKSIFDYNHEMQLDYLKKMPEPQSLIQRSYFQYKCQCYQRSSIVNFRNNLIALIILLPIGVYMFFKPKNKSKKSQKIFQKQEAICILQGVNNIVPENVKKKYTKIREIDFGKKWYLKITDLKYMKQLFYYYHAPYFVLKCIYKAAMYRAVIEDYSPLAIICSSEYSFTSSFLTWYCEQNQLQHINVMHGEKVLNICDAFFQFHENYVWDEHYIRIFKNLRAYPDQFRIGVPLNLIIKPKKNIKPVYEFTYYLGEEAEKEMLNIRSALLATKVDSQFICVRPHPRYSQEKVVYKVFKDFKIENPNQCSIDISLGLTKRIVSLCSTVLYQGFKMGKEIVIDNVTQFEKYSQLKKLDYIMLNKPHIRLSELIID